MNGVSLGSRCAARAASLTSAPRLSRDEIITPSRQRERKEYGFLSCMDNVAVITQPENGNQAPWPSCTQISGGILRSALRARWVEQLL